MDNDYAIYAELDHALQNFTDNIAEHVIFYFEDQWDGEFPVTLTSEILNEDGETVEKYKFQVSKVED